MNQNYLKKKQFKYLKNFLNTLNYNFNVEVNKKNILKNAYIRVGTGFRNFYKIFLILFEGFQVQVILFHFSVKLN